ncbi:hypothetical protein CHS0354_029593 [Potamilus streckersoni]|uniref:non-specific serine/threonine protein kinase n=1 Tax=Potamilus streckersoni TaxID=2493646 RepID=A0AAE0RTH1_9BIVA|nr:hypothetical protein CHS0354_029593 [Potamilus streckersoni]
MSDSIDQFELIKSIGKGSYGEVTLARHKRDRKQYVLKKINLKKASNRERKSAEQEAKLLSKLKHPNIVSYKDSFEKDGFLYIAMQYCDGGDLYNRLKEQHGALLEERQLVEWFVQIAMALQYMHERNILHRDLKTQNIFLTKSKIIKVGDLGIARVLESSTDMATTLIGTPYYMSPELFSNKPYNHKSDVWALGCCVYEMATLKHAFNARDMNSLVYKILKGRMPQMPKQYSADLIQLIKLMLHQDPAKRPTVNKILRDPYIKKNIAIFLEETRQSRRPTTSGSRSRPSSAASQRSVQSVDSVRSKPPVGLPPPSSGPSVDLVDSVSVVSVSKIEIEADEPVIPVPAPRIPSRRKTSDQVNRDLHPIVEDKVLQPQQEKSAKQLSSSGSSEDGNDTVIAKTVKEARPATPKKNDSAGTPQKKKKKSVLTKYSKDSHKSNGEVDSSSGDSGFSVRPSSRSVFENPKPVDIIPRPLPVPPKAAESQGLPQRREEVYNQQNEVKSTDGSKSSSNSSSKEDNMYFGEETPRSLPNLSARERRRKKDSMSVSCDQIDSARSVRLSRPESDPKMKVEKRHYEPQIPKPPTSHRRYRQPSIVDDSSSSEEEELLKENNLGQKDHEKEKYREKKEMNNFITLLDTTLNLNKEEDKSDEEQEIKRADMEQAPIIPRSASMPSVETLCNADRLMARISMLHQDCIKGVGYDILKEAYDILSRIEEDEVEPKLVRLMGKEKFDLYAGRIWQLKFCEDMARIGIPS